MPYRPAGGEAVLKPMPYRPGDPDAGMDGRYGAMDRADFLDRLEAQPEAPPSRKAQMFRNWSAIASERSRLGMG